MSVELRTTVIAGVMELTGQSPVYDHRGAFQNCFRRKETAFTQAWGERLITQVNLSRTETAGTVRGMHFQQTPYSEAKLVRCIRGRVWDVAVDMRSGSPSYGCWHACELSPEKGNALFIPEGCAHGFQVLEAGSELLYIHSGNWVLEAETGVLFNDPLLAIAWPLPPIGLSQRDLAFPLLSAFQ